MAKKKADNTDALKDIVIEAILEKKGQEVVSLDLREIHDTVAQYFIIAHGDSNTQVNAIFQSIVEDAKKHGHLPYHSEGQKNGEWIVVDFIDVVAHIFYRERRDFYQLEELWSDAKITKHESGPAIKGKGVRPSKDLSEGKRASKPKSVRLTKADREELAAVKESMALQYEEEQDAPAIKAKTVRQPKRSTAPKKTATKAKAVKKK